MMIWASSRSVDRQSLLRLANAGIAAYPPSQLRLLADWCWDHGEATGDARYCSLWRLLDVIAEMFEEHGAVSSDLIASIDASLEANIPRVLQAAPPASGAQLARELRQEIFLMSNS